MKKVFFYLSFLTFVLIAGSINVHAQSEGQKWLNEARKGNTKAMLQTAIRYKSGLDGLAKDNSKARYWAEKAANAGNVIAMVFAGNTYDDLETKKFDSKKIYWHQKAADLGDEDGVFFLRNDYTLLLDYHYLSDKAEIKKCLELILYWNKRLMEFSLEERSRRQCESIHDNYTRKLKELDADAKVETEAKPAEAPTAAEIHIVENPDEAASFPGGTSALFDWLKANMTYPQDAKDKGIEGRVVLKFVVQKDGTISKVQIMRSVNPTIDRAALRLVKTMPKWNPAKANGADVDSEYTLPLVYKL